MKKLTSLVILSFFVMNLALAQSSFTSISYDKKNQTGLMMELPYKEEVCEGFIIANLKETGYDAETKGRFFWKQNKLNGFYIFKDVKLETLDHTVDLYFKVDEKRKKDESVIYMLVGRGENYFIPKADEKVYAAAQRFMNGFIDKAAIYKLELDIQQQEELVKEHEKKLSRLKDDEKDMIRKKEQLEKDLKKNLENQENQAKEIEIQKKKLLELKEKKA